MECELEEQDGGECFVDCVGEDRISQLPDEIRLRILSLMPILHSVRTTILSKRWNNLWTSVPALDFDQNDFQGFEAGRARGCSFQKFATFVNGVISRHVSSNLKSFRLLCFPIVPYRLLRPLYSLSMREMDIFQKGKKELEDINHAHVYDWISSATTRFNTLELDLEIHLALGGGSIKLPGSVFTSKALEILRVSGCINLCDYSLDFTSTSSCVFPSLRSLYCTGLDPKTSISEELLSKCLALEHLVVDESIFASDVYDFKISTPALKLLDIQVKCSFENYKISIAAPNLESIYIRNEDFLSPNYCFLISPKCLSRANISFCTSEPIRYYFKGMHTNDTKMSLAALSNVQYLVLSLPKTFEPPLPQLFDKLKRLELTLPNYSYWGYLIDILNRSPNLEDLVLVLNGSSFVQFVKGVVQPFSPPEYVPDYVFSYLKTVFISDFMARDDEFDFVEYLLKHGQILKKITISTHALSIFESRHMTEDRLRKELSEIQELSKTCEIEIQFRPNSVRQDGCHMCNRVFNYEDYMSSFQILN